MKSQAENIPVIVVGNLSVGGTGKTPVVVWLAKYLQHQGWQPGIVSRGYKGKSNATPQQVDKNSDPFAVGDEPVLLHKLTACPVVVSRDRVAAIKELIRGSGVKVIISDDGLQHYPMHRDIEVLVIDGSRRFGNSFCLPAGPLREDLSRLQEVDFKICNGEQTDGEYPLELEPVLFINVADPLKRQPLKYFKDKKVHAVAGIANPLRFFDSLEKIGVDIIPHQYPDHHYYTSEDLSFEDDLPIIMTAKDAVKCGQIAPTQAWYLEVNSSLPEAFGREIIELLEKKCYG